MGLFGLGGSSDYLSVDFGASAIKIAKAQISGGNSLKLTLTDTGSLPDVSPDQYIEECSRVLQQLVERNDLSKKQNVILALPANDVIVRRLELPEMPDERMSKVIGYEAESHIPFPLDQVVMDHHIISRTEEGTELILAAIKEENLNEHLDVIYEADLSPEIIDVTAFAYFNLFQFLDSDNGEKAPRALVDIGHGNTDIMVFEGETLYFARSASVAGEALNEDISKKLGVDLDEAEELKHKYGHVPLAEGTREKMTEAEEIDGLSQLAEEREVGEESGPEPAESTPPAPGKEESEEEEMTSGGGLELGAPRSPEAGEESEEEPAPAPPEAEEKTEEESEGLSLGQPASPEESGEEKETSEEAPPAPPGPSPEDEGEKPEPPTPLEEEPGTGEMPSPPADSEAENEELESEPGPPEPPEKPAEDSAESPPPPTEGKSEEEQEEEEKADEELSLGAPRKPDSDSAEGSEPAAEPEVEAEQETSAKEREKEEEKETEEEENSGLDLGSPRGPAEESEENEGEEEGLDLGDGMLGGDSSSEDKGDDSLMEGGGQEDDDSSEEDEGLSLGAAANETDMEEEGDEELAADVGSSIKPQIDRLVGELRHTFDYFQSQLNGGEIEEIIISGGTSKIKNLPEFIGEQLGYTARRLEASEAIEGISEEKSHEFVVCSGLQLRANPDLVRLDVNLVPENIIQQKRAQTQSQKLTAIGVLAAVMVVLFLGVGYLLFSHRKAEFHKSQQLLEDLKPIVEQVDELKQAKTKVKKRLDVIRRLEDQKAEILPFLYELNSFPKPQYTEGLRDRSWFKSFDYTKGDPNGKFKISGVTGDFEDVSKIFKWMESKEYIISQESESMNKQSFQLGENRSKEMVTFNAQYGITFTGEKSGEK